MVLLPRRVEGYYDALSSYDNIFLHIGEMEVYKIIESHVHCGIQNAYLPFEYVKPSLNDANIEAACMYPPVEDIYDRNNYCFEDTPSWQQCRKRANDYLLELSLTENIYPYFFVWNDFRYEDLSQGFKGVKWHRHSYEPEYHYDDVRCEAFLQKVYALYLPIVFEETFENTLYFIKRVAGRTIVIIPHLGGLNGGFSRLLASGIWQEENVYADTALASPYEIYGFLENYGSEKLLYGSDFPFGLPSSEVGKIVRLNISRGDKENILGKNILRILHVAE